MVRPYLIVQLLAFFGFAVLGLFEPERFAALLGVSLSSVTALADFCATYGGMSAGVALVLALGVARPAWARPATMLAVATSFGLFAGRVLTLAQHGPAGAYIHGSMIIELGAGLAGVWLLRARPVSVAAVAAG